jgi:hypothetical protein
VEERAVTGLLYLAGIILMTLAAVGWVGGAWSSMPMAFGGTVAVLVPVWSWCEP